MGRESREKLAQEMAVKIKRLCWEWSTPIPS